jgi:hypothetical protein
MGPSMHLRAVVMRVGRGLGVVGVPLALGLVALGACAGDGASTGGGGSGPATTFSSTECGTCVTAACSNAISACQTDPACAGYLDCLLQCPVDAHGNAEPACDQGCAAAGSTETAKLESAVTACRLYGDGTSCTACAIPNQPSSGPLNQQCEPRPNAPTPCRQCYWDHCCDTWDACFADGVNPDCDALGTCIGDCINAAAYEPCVKACLDAHPGSVSTLLTQQACGLSMCAADQVDCNISLRDACDTCLYGTCGDSFVAMLSTADGYLAWLCMEDCGAAGAPGDQCVQDCVNAYPAAGSAIFLWGDCLSYQCATLC